MRSIIPAGILALGFALGGSGTSPRLL